MSREIISGCMISKPGQPRWSSDSKWLTYERTQDNGNGAIYIYNTLTKINTKATSGFYSDRNPMFDPDGKYLYLVTNRNFSPVYSDFGDCMKNKSRNFFRLSDVWALLKIRT